MSTDEKDLVELEPHLQPLTLNQRAFVAGDEGVCPMCYEEKDWAEINKEMYVCEECIHSMINDKEKSECQSQQ